MKHDSRQGLARPGYLRRMGLLAGVWLAACLLLCQGVARAQDDFLDPQEAFVFSAAMATPQEVQVHFRIAPGYYMYRKRFAFALEPDAQRLGSPGFARGTVKYDPTFDEHMEVYHQGVTIRLPLQAGAQQDQTLRITGQGCADAGLCYPPMEYTLRLVPVAGGYEARGDAVVASVPPPRDETQAAPGAPAGAAAPASWSDALAQSDTGLAAALAGAGWLELVLLAFGLGVLLTFTPCVLPMVPIVLAVVAGDARSRASMSRWRGLGLAAAYVLGMSLVYTALGIAAGLIGASLAAWLQLPWVLALFALLLALLALAMFDVYTLQAPAGMQTSLNARAGRIPGGRVAGAFAMGMVSALIVGPCVAAPLAGVLLFISQTGDVLLGGSALFALAWGQGALLLLLGATSGALLPKAGPWMDGVKRLFGMLLLATAWWMLRPVLSSAAFMLGWALLALAAAVLAGVGRAQPGPVTPGAAARLAAGWALGIWAALMLAGLAGGGSDPLQPLAPYAARSTGAAAYASGAQAPKTSFERIGSVAELDAVLAGTDRPVMLDFYADWCVSCIEMERYTFSVPEVSQRMARLRLLQVDVTANTAEHQALLKRFQLFGPPGIVFFDAGGRLLPDARVVGFQDAQRFGAVLDGVLAAAAQGGVSGPSGVSVPGSVSAPGGVSVPGGISQAPAPAPFRP